MYYNSFISAFYKPEGVTPIIIDERGCLEILGELTKTHLTSLDECRTGEVPGVFLYEIPLEKKIFDITTVRKCIQDMSLVPYTGKNIYILRSIDTASPEAMNALLKILEDCPVYASIFLVVEDSEALLETIHSRCMNLYRANLTLPLTDELKGWYEAFEQGERDAFVKWLYGKKMEKDEAISLLRYAILTSEKRDIDALEQGIIDIRMSYESPHKILETLFLIPR